MTLQCGPGMWHDNTIIAECEFFSLNFSLTVYVKRCGPITFLSTNYKVFTASCFSVQRGSIIAFCPLK